MKDFNYYAPTFQSKAWIEKEGAFVREKPP